MENLKKTLDSGANLEVTLAAFVEGHKLFKVVTDELGDIDFDNDSVQKLSFRLMSSDAVEAALWPCMGRATYNNMKLSKELFEDGDVRGDFITVAKEVLVFNLLPFSRGTVLDLILRALIAKDIAIQK